MRRLLRFPLQLPPDLVSPFFLLLAPNVTMEGVIDPVAGNVTLTGTPTGTPEGDGPIITALGFLIATADPTLNGADRRALLTQLGLDVNDPDLAGINGSLTYNGLAYRLVYDQGANSLSMIVTPEGGWPLRRQPLTDRLDHRRPPGDVVGFFETDRGDEERSATLGYEPPIGGDVIGRSRRPMRGGKCRRRADYLATVRPTQRPRRDRTRATVCRARKSKTRSLAHPTRSRFATKRAAGWRSSNRRGSNRRPISPRFHGSSVRFHQR